MSKSIGLKTGQVIEKPSIGEAAEPAGAGDGGAFSVASRCLRHGIAKHTTEIVNLLLRCERFTFATPA